MTLSLPPENIRKPEKSALETNELSIQIIVWDSLALDYA